MLYRTLLILFPLSMLLASCASSTTAPAGNAGKITEHATAPAAGAADAMVPPKDAQWTIYCLTYSLPDHPNHVAEANRMKDQLMRSTRLKAWYVVHSDHESTLYYGFYRTFNNPKDAKEATRAQRDRQSVLAIKDTSGDQPFRLALFVELSAPDPDAPPQWDLRNAKGYWSVTIAAYEGSTQRKQAAVEAVRQARSQGIEAYYYHGETISQVCVGVWPEEAVTETGGDQVAATNDPDTRILVSNAPRPEGLPSDVQTTDGDRVHIVSAPEFHIADPTLIAAMQKFPSYSVNGMVNTHKRVNPLTHAVLDQPDPSFLVKIPETREASSSGSMLSGSPSNAIVVPEIPAAAVAPEPAPAPAAAPITAPPPPRSTPQPGTGRLRSIGE